MADPETIKIWEILRQELKLLKLMMQKVIKVPGPKLDPNATMKLQEKIFDNTETAMVFSQSIAKAFKETGIDLEDEETFACLMCVVKKPAYVSEAGPTPEPSITLFMAHPDSSSDDFPFAELPAAAWRPICYIMEPVIMEAVMKKREQDKIKY